MIKQLTVIILALAIANPFCCCFGMFAQGLPTQGESTSTPPPIRSCCQSKTFVSEEGNQESPEDDTPSCPAGCACKQVYTQAEHNYFKPAKVLVFSEFILNEKQIEFVGNSFTTETFTKGLAWRPPPSRNTDFQTLYCILRT